MSKARILIVEDEMVVAEALSQKLSQLGYEAMGVTGSGEKSVALAREGRPDLVLMDIRLEGKMAEACEKCEHENPREFLRRIRTPGSRMDALITDALNCSRVVRQELTLEPVDAGALLRGMLDSYPELQRSKAAIGIRGEIPLVMGNAAGLTQCVSNLLGNAVKFVKAGEKPDVGIWGGAKGPSDGQGRRVGVGSEEGEGSRFWLDLKPRERRTGQDRETEQKETNRV